MSSVTVFTFFFGFYPDWRKTECDSHWPEEVTVAFKLLHLPAGCAPRDSFISFVLTEFTLVSFDRIVALTGDIRARKGPISSSSFYRQETADTRKVAISPRSQTPVHDWWLPLEHTHPDIRNCRQTHCFGVTWMFDREQREAFQSWSSFLSVLCLLYSSPLLRFQPYDFKSHYNLTYLNFLKVGFAEILLKWDSYFLPVTPLITILHVLPSKGLFKQCLIGLVGGFKNSLSQATCIMGVLEPSRNSTLAAAFAP